MKDSDKEPGGKGFNTNDAQPSSDQAAQNILGGLMDGDISDISDEELDLFDELEDESVLPKPASVMEVDWSLLSKMHETPHGGGAGGNGEISDVLRKLSPGNVLTEIGYAPTLLSKKTLKHVQDTCLKTRGINPESLDTNEQNKLKVGMATMVRDVLKQRVAKDALFDKEMIGLRNDMSLRRELRKPISKIGVDTNLFCSPLQAPPDYQLFAQSVDLYEKKPRNEGDPLYVTLSSKVGSIIACKS